MGGLNPVKGLDLLYALKIVKERRRDFVLEVIGDGPLRHEYETLTKRFGLEGVVKFLGLKLKEEVAEFMKRCDFFILPSIWESQSCVLIEAMACGKPVIATLYSGPEEIVKKCYGILVPPKNVAALAEAINYMLDNFQNYPPHKITLYARNTFNRKKIGKKKEDG